MITLEEIPVVSSNFSIKDTPSTKSLKSNFPVSSATIGTVYGSHSSNKLLSLISLPFLTSNVEPYGALNDYTKVLLLS